MPDSENKPDELSLIGRDGAMTGCHRSAEEGNGVSLLYEHSPEAICRCVAFDDKGLGEVWQCQPQSPAKLRKPRTALANLDWGQLWMA